MASWKACFKAFLEYLFHGVKVFILWSILGFPKTVPTIVSYSLRQSSTVIRNLLRRIAINLNHILALVRVASPGLLLTLPLKFHLCSQNSDKAKMGCILSDYLDCLCSPIAKHYQVYRTGKSWSWLHYPPSLRHLESASLDAEALKDSSIL